MIVGVPRETFPGERRVALVPQVLPALKKVGLRVLMEVGAGNAAGFMDSVYVEKGAEISADRAEIFACSDVILQVRSPGANSVKGHQDIPRFRPGQIAIGFAEPLESPLTAQDVALQGVTMFALEFMPRIGRAQTMDALSAMATLAGYKAAVLAAGTLAKIFPMLTTAAGTVSPARVFVLGAGVAGLQAIATARRLGAIVEAYDVRPAAAQDVRSLGAKFVELASEGTPEREDAAGYARAMDEGFYRRQQELLANVIAVQDAVITTAAVPGHRAPVLVSASMVRSMASGSVIVDIAAERGGNCELTRPGETVVESGVSIIGPRNLPSTVPYHASQMLGKNLASFVLHLMPHGRLNIDLEDEITRETLVTRGGEVVHPWVRELLATVPPGRTDAKE